MSSQSRSSTQLPPGSLGVPIVGESLQWAAKPFTFMEERARRWGPIFKTRILGESVVCCAGPEAIERFLDPTLVAREGATPSHLEELIGRGTLPFVDGEIHRRNKTLLLSAFDPPAMAEYVKMALPIVESSLTGWEELGTFTCYPEMEALVLAIFDRLFTSAEPTPPNDELRRNLDIYLRGVLALPLPLPWSAFRRASRAKQKLLDYLNTAVITRLLEARDEKGSALTDEQIAAEMIHVFFAGYGTMATGLTLTALALAQHPELAEQARNEVRSVAPNGEVTLAQLNRLQVVARIWREVIRFFPIVPHTVFGRVIRDFECYGYSVPAGWKATACISASLHNEDTFANPSEFDPSRFSEPREEHRQHPCAYVAQGGGPPEAHRCLGEELSAMVMKLVTSLLVRDYSWEVLDDDTSLDLTAFPPRPKTGLRVRLRRLGN